MVKLGIAVSGVILTVTMMSCIRETDQKVAKLVVVNVQPVPVATPTGTGDILDARDGSLGNTSVTVTGPSVVQYIQECGSFASDGPTAMLHVAGSTYIGPQRGNYVIKMVIPEGSYTLSIEASCPYEVR